MNTRITRTIAALCLLAPITVFGQIMGLPVKTMDGKDTQLDSYIGQGKWTLVMYWASDCIICMTEVPRIKEFHAKHKDDDAIVVGVALDGYEAKAAVQGFLDDHQPNFDNYIAELPTLMFSYQASTGEQFRGTPTFLLFTPKGELIANNPGPVGPEALERFIARHNSEETAMN